MHQILGWTLKASESFCGPAAKVMYNCCSLPLNPTDEKPIYNEYIIQFAFFFLLLSNQQVYQNFLMSLFFFFFDYSISHHFFLLFASTIAFISGTYECSVIDCEYPYSVFLFALMKYRNSNADLKVNSRNRIEWLKQIF